MTPSTQTLTDRHVSVRLSPELLLERGFYQVPGSPNEFHYDLEVLQHKYTTVVLTLSSVRIHGMNFTAFKAKRVIEYTDNRILTTHIPEKIVNTAQLAEILHYFNSLTGF